MSFSDSLNSQFDQAQAEFLSVTHASRTATQILECLKSAKDDRYALSDRNLIVKHLAEDVEAAIGCSANLMFRSPGVLHDALQALLDAYLNWYDRVLYNQSEISM